MGTALHGQVDGFREALAEMTAQELAGATELGTLAASSEPGGRMLHQRRLGHSFGASVGTVVSTSGGFAGGGGGVRWGGR
ncbi:hypothetical protein Q7C18_05445 [Nesterenkonia sp. CL21]|uniref:hypothetical protein n=1 Tax=Nesterenkonia sp. CL21 TaxID=3064894 RepID=UPI00287A0B46|nr:hypothetical protein [Nesterenkonia sp. CL21]MDS2172135.1 hypothetical protein [Nesterenkonia sp. CL21]